MPRPESSTPRGRMLCLGKDFSVDKDDVYSFGSGTIGSTHRTPRNRIPQRQFSSSSRTKSTEPLALAHLRQKEGVGGKHHGSQSAPSDSPVFNNSNLIVPRDDLTQRVSRRGHPLQYTPHFNRKRKINSKHRVENQQPSPGTGYQRSQPINVDSGDEDSGTKETMNASSTMSLSSIFAQEPEDPVPPAKKRTTPGQENRDTSDVKLVSSSWVDDKLSGGEKVGSTTGAATSGTTSSPETSVVDDNRLVHRKQESHVTRTYACRNSDSATDHKQSWTIPALKSTRLRARAMQQDFNSNDPTTHSNRTAASIPGEIITVAKRNDVLNGHDDDDDDGDILNNVSKCAQPEEDRTLERLAAAKRSDVLSGHDDDDDDSVNCVSKCAHREEDRTTLLRQVAESFECADTPSSSRVDTYKPRRSEDSPNKVIDVDATRPSNSQAGNRSPKMRSHTSLSRTHTVKAKKTTPIVPGETLERSRRRRSWDNKQGPAMCDDERKNNVNTKKNRNDDDAEWVDESIKRKKLIGQVSATKRNTRCNREIEDFDRTSLSPIGSRRSNRIRNRLGKTPETIDISSGSDDSENDNDDYQNFDIQRCTIENIVYPDCKLTYHIESKTMVLNLPKASLYNGRLKKITFALTAESVEDTGYFGREEEGKRILKSLYEDDGDDSFVKELDCLVALTVFDDSLESRLRGPQLAERKRTRLVLEFDDERKLRDFIDVASDEGIKFDSMQPIDAKLATNALIEHSKKMYNLRNKVTPSKKKDFFSGKRSDEILLVYPFDETDQVLDEAAECLDELSFRRHSGDVQDRKSKSSLRSDEREALMEVGPSQDNSTMKRGRQRSHYITIRVEDYQRLDDGQWLNDSLVDFWMQWISRGHGDVEASDCHFFTSHFYSALTSQGEKGVESWTAKKNIDVFKKKLIFIPINMTLHWSLCVVLNPGAIMNDGGGKEDRSSRRIPCMLFFDSLNMHRKARVRDAVISWLNSEWVRLRKKPISGRGPYTRDNFRILSPKVPLQNNGWDCGVFVCRYAYGMYRLSEAEFTYELAELKGNDNELGFPNFITKSDAFDFNMEDIGRIRLNFQILIQKLFSIYSRRKASDKLAKKESKEKTKVLMSSQQVEDQKMNSVRDTTSKETSQGSLASEDQNLRIMGLAEVINDQSQSVESMSSSPADCHAVI